MTVRGEKPKAKPKGLEVGKYEVSDGKVKFYTAKGFGKKQWVLVREVSVSDVERVETEGNQIGLTVKGAAEWFTAKDKTETFSSLAGQIDVVNVKPAEPAAIPQEPETVEPQQEISEPQQETSPPANETPPPQPSPEPVSPPQTEPDVTVQKIPETQPAAEPPATSQPAPQLQQEPIPTIQQATQTQPEQEPAPTVEPQPLEQTETKLDKESQPEQPPQPEPLPQEQTQQKPKKEPKKKLEGLQVGKYEVSEDKIKFFVSKGLFKKKWVAVREIPMVEVEHVESEGRQLKVTSKGTAESFYHKEKAGSFVAMAEQVNGILEEQREAARRETEANLKAALRRTELLTVIGKSIDVIDSTFNLIISLQEKRIDWLETEAFASKLDEKLNFTGQSLPALSLDYTKVVSSVKTHVPRDASKEAFNVLKLTYGYFDGLKPEDDIKDNPPNFQTAKTLINAYYLLNDLLLSRFVGDKDNAREISELEAALQSLAESNFKVDLEALKGGIDVADDRQTVVEDSRAIFKEQLKQL